MQSGEARLSRHGATAKYDGKCRGVNWHKKNNCWQVQIMVHNKNLHGGIFHAKDASDEAREEARLKAVDARAELGVT